MWFDSTWGVVGYFGMLALSYYAGKKRGLDINIEKYEESEKEPVRPRFKGFEYRTPRKPTTPPIKARYAPVPIAEPSEEDMDMERQRWRLQSQERQLKNQLKSVKDRQKAIIR